MYHWYYSGMDYWSKLDYATALKKLGVAYFGKFGSNFEQNIGQQSWNTESVNIAAHIYVLPLSHK